jgi:predicted DNA-binding protein (UPF0251 family)
MQQIRIIGISDKGKRVGHFHQKAKLTDDECELVRSLRGSGMRYSELAEKFEISKACVRDIVKFRRRNVPITRWKSVKCA